MNETLPDMAGRTGNLADATTLDHFLIGLDDDGNEVKVKVNALGELEHIQDIDDVVYDDDSFEEVENENLIEN